MPPKNNTAIHKKSPRSGRIELMRFICAVTVAGYHLGCSVEYPFELFQNSYMAVEFFFIVSGYLLAKSLRKYSVSSTEELLKTNIVCTKKRLMSFWYYYLSAIIFTSAAWVPYFGLTFTGWLEKMLGAVPNFLLLQVFGFKGADWFVPTWYLSVLMFCGYILTAIMLKYKQIYALYISPVVFAAFFGLIAKYNPTFDVNCFMWKGIINFGFLRGFADMSIGCTCYYIVKSGFFDRFDKRIVSGVGFISAAALIVSLIFGSGYNIQILSLVCSIVSVPILFWDNTAAAGFNNKVMYYLGRLSLPIYLCHSITRYYVLASLPNAGYAAQLLVFYAFTLAISAVCAAAAGGMRRIFGSKK